MPALTSEAATLTLHLRGIDEDAHRLVTPVEDVEDVLDGSATRRSDQSDAARQRGKRLLAGGLEQAFRRELGLQLLEGDLQRPGALGLEVLGLKLQVAALVVER